MEKFNNIIHYEENIFYLKLLLVNIQKLEKININKELFKIKIKQDMIFIYKVIQTLNNHLLKNDKLLTKNEQLHSLIMLKKFYNTTILQLINNKMVQIKDFENFIKRNKDDINILDDMLVKKTNIYNKEDLTTNEELDFLFRKNLDNEI